MRIFQFVFFLVLIVSSVFHLAESEMHRFVEKGRFLNGHILTVAFHLFETDSAVTTVTANF